MRILQASPTSSSTVTTGGNGTVVGADATITRPNNATPYTAHKAIGSASVVLFTFTNFFRVAGGTGVFAGSRLQISTAGTPIVVPSGIQIRAHLFNSVPTLPAGDQSPLLTLDANADKRLGTIDFTSWQVGDTDSDLILSHGIPNLSPWELKAATGSRNLYAVLEASVGFIPPASGKFRLYLGAVLD